MMPGLLCSIHTMGPSWPWGSKGTWSHDDPLIPGIGGSVASGGALPLPHTVCTCPDRTSASVTQPLCQGLVWTQTKPCFRSH